MKRRKFDDREIGGINIAPVINLAFILLIILMISAPMLDIPNLPVELPEAVTKEAKEKNITVTLARDGRLAIDAEIITLDTLVPKLRAAMAANRDAVVIIRADKETEYKSVDAILNLIVNKAGAKRVAVATRQRSR